MRVYIRPTHLKFVKLSQGEIQYVSEAASECRRVDVEKDVIVAFGTPAVLFHLLNEVASCYDLEII